MLLPWWKTVDCLPLSWAYKYIFYKHLYKTLCLSLWYMACPCVSSVIYPLHSQSLWPTFSFLCEKKLLSLVQSPLSSKATLHPLLLLLLLLSRSVVSDSVRPHRRQPTRLPHPWVSPGKNTGVGCHFLLQYTHYYLSNLYPTKVPKRYFWNPI